MSYRSKIGQTLDHFYHYTNITKERVNKMKGPMKGDVWKEITHYSGLPPLDAHHPPKGTVSKEVLMENSPFDQLFNEDDWSVVRIPKTNTPWMVHYCYDQIYRGMMWNYVISSPIALENYTQESHYTCATCSLKAPDSAITVLRMLA